MTDTHPDHQTRRIEIPEATAEAIAQRLEGTEFETIDDYATFALEQLLDQLHRHDTSDDSHQFDHQDIEDAQGDAGVEDRLESLGYL